MIGNQCIPQTRSFFFPGRIEFHITVSGKDTFQSRIQNGVITNTGASTGLLSQDLMKKQYYFF